MAVEVRLPKFSEEMTEATISRWLKQVGDSVDKGEAIVEVETEKVIVEVEAPRAGVIVQIAAQEQEVVPVDGLLCTVGQAREMASGQAREMNRGQARETASGQDAEEVESQASVAGAGESTPAQAAMPLDDSAPGKDPATPVAMEAASGSNVVAMVPREQPQAALTPASVERPAEAAPEQTAGGGARSSGAVHVSPLARRVAEELGIDLTSVSGSGIGGKIVMADLQPYLDRQAATGHATPEGRPASLAAVPSKSAAIPGNSAPELKTGILPPAPLDPVPLESIASEKGTGIVVPHSPLRRTIARRLGEAKRTIPHFYMTAEIDVTEMLGLRTRLNEALAHDAQTGHGQRGHGKSGHDPERIGVNDLVIKAVATTLGRVPALNATYGEDAVTRHEGVHVGFATAIEEGLVTPVVRDCRLKSLGHIARETAWLIEQARTRRLLQEHMEGGTFTISNLGMYPVVEFSAIINPPQVGILAVAQPEEKPVSLEGRMAFRKRMRVTLSADHRAVDGVTGAEFLAELKELLEHPERLML